MGKTRLHFLLPCLLLLVLSCKDNQEDEQLLESIEQTWQLCETSLSEAGARAEELADSVHTPSEYARQKYDLLTIRLRDKSYIIPSSPDSAIQTASYFEGRKNPVDKERAYYYLGSAYRDLKDYPRAVTFYLKAAEEASRCGEADTLVWQNSLSQLRYLCMLQLNYEEELNAALQTVELAKLSGKNLGFYLTDAATAYEHLGDTLLCLQYCDQSYRVIQKDSFSPKYGGVLAYLLTVYTKYNHYEMVDTLLRHLLELPETRRPHNYELSLAKTYEKNNRTDSAIFHYKTYYDKEKTMSGRYEASAGLQRCYLQKRNYRLAAEWGCRLYDTNDSIIARRAFEETQRARDTYIYYRDKEKEQAIMLRDEALARRNGRIVSFSVISGLVLLCVILGVLLFYNYRKKKFLEEIFGKDKEILERSKELKQRAMINRELTQIALMDNATNNAENVIEHFRKVSAGQARLKANSWRELMTAIEVLYPGFLEKVQGRFKKDMREPLLRTICLMKIGMKPIQICRVMDAKKQTVWNRIKRAEETCGDLLAL